ncbi:putative AbiEi antitoxin of type IV toxin-antitoxin system [Kribbella sp. VKM Ac-2527]|uniref:Putative AbiEi antitoxin of type IV toxin-antitoxin system n=2 Tax=Kribbella caucasensis TaxID=2512215 RepID=A0A4R6KPM8_9ACTN|nr:putative AbiEi antitoxin of type IV toxin-antitoxin system [Kribbella sp. VKM Ac-2527]
MTAIRGGVFTRADARACGYPDPDIDSLLDSGGWRRIRPGTYAPYRDFAVVTDEMLHLRGLHRVLRSGEPGLIASHQSAAALHALPLWGLDLTQIHVTTRTAHSGHRPSEAAAGSRDSWAVIGADEVCRHVRDPIGPGVQVWNNLRLVSPARAVAEVAATSPLVPGVVVAEAALAAGIATSRTLQRAASQLVEGIDQAERVVAQAQPESASVAESRLRLILSEAGLPTPSTSAPPAIDVDQTGCALWFPDERTVVEFDPRRPFWCQVPDDYLDDTATRFFAPRPGVPTEPEPLEYCWISWTDLDDPPLVVDRVRATFARASRRTGVRIFDPTRSPRSHRRRRTGSTQPDYALPSDHDIPG